MIAARPNKAEEPHVYFHSGTVPAKILPMLVIFLARE